MRGLGHGHMAIRLKSYVIHQQRMQMGQVATRYGQHGQAPGVHVAPIRYLAFLQPRCREPAQIEPGP